MPAGPISLAPDGVHVAVRVVPRASRTALLGLAAEADGSRVVKLAVTAVPKAGKANAAVIKLLAKAWGVPKSSIRIATGSADRRKVLHIAGSAPDLFARLGRLVADLPLLD